MATLLSWIDFGQISHEDLKDLTLIENTLIFPIQNIE